MVKPDKIDLFHLRSFFSLFISISISAQGRHYHYQQFSSCYTTWSYNTGPDQIFSKTKLLLLTDIHSTTCYLSQLLRVDFRPWSYLLVPKALGPNISPDIIVDSVRCMSTIYDMVMHYRIILLYCHT